MPRVSVKAVKGRIARTAPDGPFIPDNEFVSIERTRYVSRLIDVHGDLIVEPKAAKKPPAPEAEPMAAEPAPKPKKG